jgi:hypothetical protein
METTRKQVNYGEVVGVTPDGEVYILDYVFDHGNGHVGAVGSILRPVTQNEYDEATGIDGLVERFEDVWRMMVADGNTDSSLEEWAQSVHRYDGDEAIWDHSDYDKWDEARYYVAQLEAYQDEVEEANGNLENAFPVMESIGGGRIFDRFDAMVDMFERMPNTELWFEINRYENK